MELAKMVKACKMIQTKGYDLPERGITEAKNLFTGINCLD